MAKETDTNAYTPPVDNRQKRPFKYKRAGVELTQDEVREIKAGRKKLRAELRAQGIKSKKEFELTASSMGLYFDKHRGGALLLWFLGHRAGWLLLAAALLLMLALFGLSAVTELQGHFTVSMSDDLFREGFTLSETKDFRNPTSHLFSTPAEGVPCVSILSIPENVDQIDGAHHDTYLAYTFYVRNEGESPQGLEWALQIRGESRELSEAAWIMIFVDGEMSFYAKRNRTTGQQELIPAPDETGRAYGEAPLYELAKDPQAQYEALVSQKGFTYWRLKPYLFAGDKLVQTGQFAEIVPGEVHKFTVVVWLEGDDPDCTNDRIGGHLGLEFEMNLIEKE